MTLRWVVPVAAIALIVVAASPRARAEVPARPSAGCTLDQLETGARLERTIDIDGVQRTYVLHVPARVKPHEPVPLMFDFHGIGHSGGGVWKVSGFRDLGERDGFITVYPDGLPVTLQGGGRTFEGPGWQIAAESNRDLKFTVAMLDALERTYCIDQARVFSTGFSNGAYFSHLLGCVLSDRIAAIAPVSGGRVPVACAPRRGVPVLIYHGRQDELIPLSQAHAARDQWLEIDQCREHASNGCEWHRQCRDGAAVEYCEGDFAHRWPAEATARIWEFFTQHPLKQ
jgi:polyhydroxybutyrate depolymerase